MPFTIDPFVKRLIAEGRSEVELTLAMANKISAFEARRHAAMPWVFRRPGGGEARSEGAAAPCQERGA
jgi:hypothetical protein